MFNKLLNFLKKIDPAKNSISKITDGSINIGKDVKIEIGPGPGHWRLVPGPGDQDKFTRLSLDSILATVQDTARAESAEKNDLPPEAVTMLREMGLSPPEIQLVKLKYGGTGSSIFIPPPDDKAWDEFLLLNENYLAADYKNNLHDPKPGYRALAELVANNPDRARVAQNYRLMREREKGINYRNGNFITNYFEYSYYTVDVRKTLGVKIIPANRQSANGKPGIFDIANLAAAIQQNKLNRAGSRRAIKLAQRLYNRLPRFTAGELNEFALIIRTVPDYTANYVTWHENLDGHTLDLVPSGKLHSGKIPGGLYHTGGNSLIEEAETILADRRSQPRGDWHIIS
jgi:hypothetical protein